jgi:hypothetical protein
MDQLSIDLSPRTHARTSDPQTSKDAAKRLGFAVSQCDRILTALPGIAEEIASTTGLNSWQVSKRLSDLQRAGLAKASADNVRLASSGRKQMVWERV